MKIPRSDGVVDNRQTAGNLSTSVTQNAASTFSLATGIVDKLMDQRAENEAQEVKNSLLRKHNDLNLKYRSRTGKDALGSTMEIEKESREIEQEMTANLSSRAKTKLGDFGVRIAEQSRSTVMGHEAAQEQAYKLDNFNKGTTLAEEMVRQDATNWRLAAAHLNETLEGGLKSGLIKEEEFITKSTEIQNKFRGEAGKAYYTQNKHAFMKEINEFGFGKPEIAAWENKYKDDLKAEERERKSLYAEEARMIMGQREDMKAQALANFDASHFSESAKKLEAMGYKDWAKDLRDDGKLYEKTIAFESKHKNVPLAEKFKAAKELTVSNELDGSGVEFKSRKTIQAEVLKQVKTFNSDPAQYVSAWAQGNNPEEIASSRISLQSKQGIVPEKGYRILTTAEKSNLKGAWEAGDIKQRTQLIRDASLYGKHSSKVLSEMDINPALSFAPFVESDREVELMVAAVSTKAEVTGGIYKEADYTARAKESRLYKLMAEVQKEFPTDVKIGEKLKGLETMMSGIGMRKMSPGAGTEFFDQKFTIEKDTDKMIYFPKSMDGDEIITALDKKKADISKSINTGKSESDTVAKWAVRDFTWVNSASGFVLADKKSGRIVPGSTVEYVEISDSFRSDVAKKKIPQNRKVTAIETLKNLQSN